MKYGIGLDCGIASVGFSVVELDCNDEPRRIIKLGSRIFDKAEVPKTGSSLALPRREARGARRRIRRHQHRLDRIRYMLVQEKIVTQDELDNLFSGQLSDIYELRVKALDKPISNTEFARILINLAQRRGFKSNRKVDAEDKKSDAGKLLTAVNENYNRMQNNGYRTVGEMLFKDEAYSKYKRNKGEDYLNTVSRDMIADEIKAIFSAQRKMKNSFANERIENIYTEIVLSQRPFDLGPGQGPENCRSPYAGNQIEKMIGKCTFYPEENRAAKATYSFQLFTLLQNINSIMLISESGDRLPLSLEEKKKIRTLCFSKKDITYASIRKELGISKDYKFNSLSYGKDDLDDIEKKAKFNYLKQYYDMKKVLGDTIHTLSFDELDEIGRIFTLYKNDEKIIEELSKTSIDKSLYDVLLKLPSFSKFGHISVKACKEIIPYLEQGLLYNEACEKAGINFKAHNQNEKQHFLQPNSPTLDDIVNPVVRRAVSQTIKVVNAIIREQGVSPTYINIELARELSKSFDERRKIEKQYENNRKANDIIRQEIINDFHVPYPSGFDIVKLKLWHEQDGIDPYTLKPIEADKLFGSKNVGYVDVDHIIPYSISFDDSYNNKVLTFSAENRQKKNKIPMEYISDDKKSNYQVWVENNIKNYKKRQNLLKKKLTKEDLDGFKTRNLNDTKYLSKVLYNYINDTLEFDEFNSDKKKHVTAVNGAVTAYMRRRWGITKIREDGDLHHAVDATVIACTTQGMINDISKFSNYLEVGENIVDRATGEVIEKFPMPYPTFRNELEIRTETEDEKRLREKLNNLPNYTYDDIENTNPCFVSRMPNHKVTGPAHQETIRSGKEDGYTISKVALKDLKLKDGEIQNYYNPSSDLLLYNALKQKLVDFDGNAEKAFAEDFYKPKSDGTQGPLVKKVKIIEKSSLNVPVKNGVAANGSMVRIDVFYVENDGYYFVPIYIANTVKDELPNKACSRGKEGWKEMDEKDFIFSLYPNDLIKVRSNKDLIFSIPTSMKNSTLPRNKYSNDIFLYYNSAGISTASITVYTHDGAYVLPSLGVKSLASIEKYQVDAIGNISKVGKEERKKFNL